MKKKLKLFAVPIIYISAIALFGTSMYLIQSIFNDTTFKDDANMEYVDKEIVTDNEYIPVVNIIPTIMKPFLNENVTINKTFYKYNDDKANQEKAIIMYENTYMQNTGVDYKLDTVFDIVSILDGTVIDINENEILGKTIKIRHNNDIISTYQCLGEIFINKDDSVLRGQIIAKSGTCKLYSSDYNLHFELSYQGKNIDPEENYYKNENEL